MGSVLAESYKHKVQGGTPAYIAPEAAVACIKALCDVHLKPEMDIYAVGLIMHQLLRRATVVETAVKVGH